MDKRKTHDPRATGAVLVLSMVWTLVSVAAANPPVEFKHAIDLHADAIVTVTFVMKMEMGMMGSQESESEIPGVVVDPKGLVLVANSQLSGPMTMLKRFMPPGMEMSAEPKDLKVVIGADDNEYEAKILARDTDLDLAWIQIDNKDNTKFAAVDLSDRAPLALGQKLISVRRLGKLFNRAPAVRTGRICGETDSPRHLYIGNTELATTVGLPVFTLSGKLAGMVVMQMPDEDEDTTKPANPMAMFGSMSSMMEMFSGVILPADVTVKATQRVRDTYMTKKGVDEK